LRRQRQKRFRPYQPDMIRSFENRKSISMYNRKHLFAEMAILPLFFALTLTASPNPPQVTISQLNAGEMKFRITVINPSDRTLAISIQHGHDVLFEDLTAKPTYENVFNLSDLEDGDYLVLITSGKEKISRALHIQTKTKVDRLLTVE
jgi:hypothetical protein